jgi:phage terminase large subunit
VREIQKSIADSVHQLLSDQIQELGLGDFYTIKRDYIEGKNGTLFAFRGLSSETALSLKSFERPTICWVEEAQAITKRSWGILEPTIRADGSEIWVCFNPELEDDFIYKEFVLGNPPQAVVTKIGWEDNPWRSKVLDARREQMKRDDPEEYEHVYGGACRPAVEGAIYYKEVTALKNSGRLCNVPYDPMLKVHVVTDLGFNDYMSLILVQRLASEIRVIRYIEDRQRYIPSYSQELKDLKLNYGKLYLPHDGKAKHVTGSSAEEQFRALGWDVEIVPDIGLEQGIRKLREVFSRLYVDKGNASELVNRLGRYRRRVNSEGQASTPVHDDESHGADGTRYLAIVADQMSNDSHKVENPNAAFRRTWAA